MFDPDRYGPLFGALLREPRLNELGPGRPDATAQLTLKSLDLTAAFAPQRIRDRSMAEACLAGLWLYFDDLEASHRISQSLNHATGNYWHSIMHRREPDAWNSKYWLDRTGRHPVFPALCRAARELTRDSDLPAEARFLRDRSEWDPYAFVDLCEAARTGKSATAPLCRRVQQAEWQLLFDYCFHQAAGV